MVRYIILPRIGIRYTLPLNLLSVGLISTGRPGSVDHSLDDGLGCHSVAQQRKVS
jgi:hypothetical protein